MTDISPLSGLHALVVGLGREGVALATYLAQHNFTVTGTDLQPEENLGMDITPLKEAGVSLVLGEHPTSLLDEINILFVSPGVPLESPFLQEAQARKIPLSTESRLFCHLCPVPIYAITGSSGKTTTTTLLGKMLEADGRQTWVGGNIGQPLIGILDQIEPEDAVVMELSSFQLEYFHAKLNKTVDVEAVSGAQPEELATLLANWSPAISAILNITPNHLDRHPSMKHYVRAKRALINYQNPGQRNIIMSLDNDMTRTIGNQFGNATRWFSLEARQPGGAALVKNDLVLFDWEGTPQQVAARSEVKLRGMHNISNILAACLMAREAGVSLEAMREVITTFTGVPHRLQKIREHNQVTYYNDSVSTTPERLIAALRSFDEPMVLLVGGRDKYLPWEDAARLMIHKTHAVILFGEVREKLAPLLEKVSQEITVTQTVIHCRETVDEAVSLAAQLAHPGDVVLLSPGCTSFDAFVDFAERGEHFKELVWQL